MKLKSLIIHIALLTTLANAQVGINTSTPNSNSVLELNSHFSSGNYGGFMPPKLTIAERDAIPVTVADDGLMAYVSGFAAGERCLQLFNGSKLTWESIQCFEVPSVPLVVWLETMGNPSATTNATTYTGYSTLPASTFTSGSSTKPTVASTAPVSSTIGGSGAGHLFFTGGANRELIIGGINVSSYTGPLKLELLIYKALDTGTGSELVITYFNSTTSSWIPVTVTDLPTGTGTGGIWYSRTISLTVPNSITQISFSRTAAAGGPDYRIDDIKITRP